MNTHIFSVDGTLKTKEQNSSSFGCLVWADLGLQAGRIHSNGSCENNYLAEKLSLTHIFHFCSIV